jgi:hypothetical protein
LQRSQLSNQAGVAAVANCAKVLGIKLWEKRITILQVWIMRPEARFENLATITNRFEPPARGLAMAVVSSQIAQRLFAFEYCCRSNLLSVWPITNHVGPISALW